MHNLGLHETFPCPVGFGDTIVANHRNELFVGCYTVVVDRCFQNPVNY